MYTQLCELKESFNGLVETKNDVIDVLSTLESRIYTLKNLYVKFIKSNSDSLFIFGLDSLHYQTKLIDIEYYDMRRIFLSISNRMYGEYYKLYKMIVEYILENVKKPHIVKLIKDEKTYTVYNDLEPFKEYHFDMMKKIHDDIIVLLKELNTYLTVKESQLNTHKEKNECGLNIDNFVNAFKYNNSMLRENLALFVGYTMFFHKSHSKHLERFDKKIQLFLSQINSDINFENATDENEISSDTDFEIKKFVSEIVNTVIRQAIDVQASDVQSDDSQENESMFLSV